DNQYGLTASERQRRRSIRRDRVRRRSGQPNFEAASATRFAQDVNGSLMIADDFANRCETEARYRHARREERLEHSPRDAFVDSATIVGYGKAHVATGREFAVIHCNESG